MTSRQDYKQYFVILKQGLGHTQKCSLLGMARPLVLTIFCAMDLEIPQPHSVCELIRFLVHQN